MSQHDAEPRLSLQGSAPPAASAGLSPSSASPSSASRTASGPSSASATANSSPSGAAASHSSSGAATRSSDAVDDRAARAGLGHELRLALIALQFLTRVPVPQRVGFAPAWLHASARHFPLVGLALGAVIAAVLWAAARCWPAPVAVGLAIATGVWLTGGFHEDGLADTCDGLGGSVGRERALAIMKDSRLGSYGALGLLLVLGLKAAALLGLLAAGMAQALSALWLAQGASRAATVLLLRMLPYAGDVEQAKAKPMAQQVSRRAAAIALAWPALAALTLAALLGRSAWPSLTVALAGAALATIVCAHWFRRRLGGYTGDTLGATQQFSELALLLGWLAAVAR